MIRGLKIALIAYGVIGILLGPVFVVVPYQVASMFGLGEIAAYVPYFMAMCGVSFMAPAVWLIVAGRDQLRHITWVKFAILWVILCVEAGAYSIVRGGVDFSQIGPGIIIGAVFVVGLLALYPYRASRPGQ